MARISFDETQRTYHKRHDGMPFDYRAVSGKIHIQMYSTHVISILFHSSWRSARFISNFNFFVAIFSLFPFPSCLFRLVCIYRVLLLTFSIFAFALGSEPSLDDNLFALGSSGSLNTATLPLNQLTFSPSPLVDTGALSDPDSDNLYTFEIDKVTLNTSEPFFTDFILPTVDQTASSLSPLFGSMTLPSDTELNPFDGSESLFTTDDEDSEILDDSILAGCSSSPVDKSRRRMRRDGPWILCTDPAARDRKRKDLTQRDVVGDTITLGQLQDLFVWDRRLRETFKNALGDLNQNILCDMYTGELFPWGMCSAAIGVPSTLLQIRAAFFFTSDYDPARIGTL